MFSMIHFCLNLSCSEVLTAIVKEVVDLVEDILAENRCMCVDGCVVNSCYFGLF